MSEIAIKIIKGLNALSAYFDYLIRLIIAFAGAWMLI